MPSFTSTVLRREPDEETEDALKWAATAIYGGGSDPSSAVLGAFFLIMLLFPEARDKAQAEIDSVVGTHRLPTFADRENLPYVEALMKELIRWHPVGRLCKFNLNNFHVIRNSPRSIQAFPTGHWRTTFTMVI